MVKEVIKVDLSDEKSKEKVRIFTSDISYYRKWEDKESPINKSVIFLKGGKQHIVNHSTGELDEMIDC